MQLAVEVESRNADRSNSRPFHPRNRLTVRILQQELIVYRLPHATEIADCLLLRFVNRL